MDQRDIQREYILVTSFLPWIVLVMCVRVGSSRVEFEVKKKCLWGNMVKNKAVNISSHLHSLFLICYSFSEFSANRCRLLEWKWKFGGKGVGFLSLSLSLTFFLSPPRLIRVDSFLQGFYIKLLTLWEGKEVWEKILPKDYRTNNSFLPQTFSHICLSVQQNSPWDITASSRPLKSILSLVQNWKFL